MDSKFKAIKKRFQSKIKFEKIIFNILKTFLKSSTEKLECCINKVLKIIAEYTFVDRCYLFLKVKDGDEGFQINEYCKEGIESYSSNYDSISLDTPKWWLQKLVKNNYVYISSLEEIDNINVKKRLEQKSIKTILLLPVIVYDEFKGFLGLESVCEQKKWGKNNIKSMQIIVDILYNSIKRKKAEMQIEKEKELYDVTVQAIKEAVITIDNNSKIILFNRAAENLIGIKHSYAKSKNINTILNLYNINKKEQDKLYVEDLIESEQNNNNSYVLINNNDKKKIVSVNVSRLKDYENKIAGKVIVLNDITQKYRNEKKVKYLSMHDKLTGVYNRGFFEDEIHKLDFQGNYPLSIMMIDLNGLKMLNDVFGHHIGDSLLSSSSEILKQSCKDKGVIGRVGGDEFIIALPNTSYKEADDIKNKIKNRCSKKCDLPIQISMSIGIAVKEDNNKNFDEIIKTAEEKMYAMKLKESKNIKRHIVNLLIKRLQEKTYETEQHSVRMKKYAVQLGEKIGLKDNKIEELELLAVLHDIGKISIPQHIIQKEGELTKEEWKIIKTHPESGYRIATSTPEMASIAEYILSHHERWDGKGYPQGLKEDEIPLLSRIISVVDAYDVMTNERPYYKLKTKEEAIEELKRNAGTQFDPEIVERFVEILGK